MSDFLSCKAEIREGERLHGVMLQEGRAGRLRRELFVNGAVRWPAAGVGILTKHRTYPAVARAIPSRKADGRLVIEAPATPEIREAVAGGRRYMSIEFHSLRESRTTSGIREVEKALVEDVALVSSPEYGQAQAEIRQLDYSSEFRPGVTMDCACPGNVDRIEFTRDAFRGVEDRSVLAIGRGDDSVLGTTTNDSLTLRRLASGALQVALRPLNTEAGRRIEEVIREGVTVFARPLIDMATSTVSIDGAVALVSAAVFTRILVRPVPEEAAKGVPALTAGEPEGRSLSLTAGQRAAIVATLL